MCLYLKIKILKIKNLYKIVQELNKSYFVVDDTQQKNNNEKALTYMVDFLNYAHTHTMEVIFDLHVI